MDNEYEIFISYSRRDLEQVSAIKAEIEKVTDAHCWMDLEGIEAGTRRFTKAIVDGIKNCRVFLFMCSEQSQNSEFALRELNYASKRRKHVVIVRIDDKPLNDEFEFLYGLTDTIEWNNQPQRKKLFREIKRWIGINEDVVHEKKKNEAPIVIEQKKELGTEIHIETDANCNMYRFRTFIKLLKANDDGVVHLKPGTHKLEFVSEEFPEVKVSKVYSLERGIDCDYISVSLKNQVEEERAKRMRVAEEARKNNLKGDEFYNRKNYDEAVRWYRKAADQGDANAQSNLGWMYRNGYGVPQSYDEALRWYRKAVEQGHANAQNNLGWMYQNGYGVPQSNDEAVTWYRKAADKGHANAQNNLGVMYRDGYGVPQSYDEALRWYRKAADQGNATAQFNLGRMYEIGKGVPQSDEAALRWYRKAADQGNAAAKSALKRLTGK